MQPDLAGLIANRLQAANIPVPSHEHLELHQRYLQLLEKWNRTINLTSLQLDPPSDDAIDRLVVEPIAASLLAGQPEKIIDLGSGGGSPAIPFWIQLPGSFLTMVESRSRKCAFLREAVRQIRPGQAEPIDSRFEDLLEREPRLRASADIVSIRAVRLDREIATLVSALLKPSGQVFHFAEKLEIVDCSTWNKTWGKERGSS